MAVRITAKEKYDRAINALRDDNFEEGVFWMKQAAHSWYKGFYGSARKWIKRYSNIAETKMLADNGNPQAMMKISEYYFYHSPNNNSLRLAHEWNERAAKLGYAPAMANQGVWLIYGWAYVGSNLKDAFGYLSRAEQQHVKDDVGYLGYLGCCYLFGWGTHKDEKKGIMYLKAGERARTNDWMCKNVMTAMKTGKQHLLKSSRVLKNIRRFYN